MAEKRKVFCSDPEVSGSKYACAVLKRMVENGIIEQPPLDDCDMLAPACVDGCYDTKWRGNKQ